MKPTMIWKTESDWLYVRFEHVGHHYKFQQSLIAFRSQFDDSTWFPDSRYWRLPISEIQRLAAFATEHFGPNTMQYINDTAHPIQLPLFK